ncbi:MAG: hypothetical protein EAY75_17915 [Bacteroidetes bacterium]|nr:MAG: hypothetical protein EAY75_17915 [Bacteroidota bacterium]
MTYDFVISLKRPNYRGINTVSVLLVIIFLLTYCFYLAELGYFLTRWWLLAIPFLVVGLLLYGFFNRKRADFLVHHRLELNIAAMGFVAMTSMPNNYLWAVLYALVGVAERLVKRPNEIYFSKEEIVRNTLWRKTYQWFEVENVVLRDNLFTLDLRNNRLIQGPLDQPTDVDTEVEFNAFCKAQLHFTEMGAG